MLSVIMMCCVSLIVMLNVVMLSLIMLIVVEPIQWTSTGLFFLSISDEKRKFCDINT